MFGSRHGLLHPEPAIWLGSVHAHSHDELALEAEKEEDDEEEEKEELHLAGGRYY